MIMLLRDKWYTVGERTIRPGRTDLVGDGGVRVTLVEAEVGTTLVLTQKQARRLAKELVRLSHRDDKKEK